MDRRFSRLMTTMENEYSSGPFTTFPWDNASVMATKPKIRAFSLKNYFESGAHIYFGYIGPIITCVVVIMNISIVATIIRGRFRSSTYAVMIAIAIADALTGIVPLPFNIQVFSVKRSEDFLKIEWCYLFEIFQIILPTLFHFNSIGLTVGLSIERFFVVTFPIKARTVCTMKNGVIFSFVVFVISICVQIDSLLDVSFEPVEITSRNGNFTIQGCIRNVKDRSEAEFIARQFILRLLPCIILVVFTVLLLWKSSEIKNWRKSHSVVSQKATESLERMDFVVSFIAVVVVVTEITVGCLLLIEHLTPGRQITDSNSELSGIIYVIYIIFSPVNFAILCFLSAKFRKTFRDMILDIFVCRRKKSNS